MQYFQSNTTGHSLSRPGGKHLDAFGLIHMNGRIYDPHLARVLNPDPIILDMENIQSYNRYSYCLNNPLKYSDPTGYWPFDKDHDGCKDISKSVTWWDRLVSRFHNRIWDPIVRSFEGGGSENGTASHPTNIPGTPVGGNLGISTSQASNHSGTSGYPSDEKDVLDPKWGGSINGLLGENTSDLQLKEDPTIDKGGFIDADRFYDYMLNHARNTPVEVSAVEMIKEGARKIFILPWKDNLPRRSYFDPKVIIALGYKISNIVAYYHTHRYSGPPSGTDKNLSDEFFIPVYVIGANGKSYVYCRDIEHLQGKVEPDTLDLKKFLILK